MFTTIDIVDKFYTLLHLGGITNLYKNEKPLNESKDEYTVINTLSATADMLQECPVNVNYHCKDIDTALRIANDVKLNDNAKAIISLLDDYCDSDIDISMNYQTTIQEEAIPEHFVNIRFTARHVN